MVVSDAIPFKPIKILVLNNVDCLTNEHNFLYAYLLQWKHVKIWKDVWLRVVIQDMRGYSLMVFLLAAQILVTRRSRCPGGWWGGRFKEEVWLKTILRWYSRSMKTPCQKRIFEYLWEHQMTQPRTNIKLRTELKVNENLENRNTNDGLAVMTFRFRRSRVRIPTGMQSS